MRGCSWLHPQLLPSLGVFDRSIQLYPKHAFPDSLPIVREEKDPIPRLLKGEGRMETRIEGIVVQAISGFGQAGTRKLDEAGFDRVQKRSIIAPVYRDQIEVVRGSPFARLHILEEAAVQPLKAIHYPRVPNPFAELQILPEYCPTLGRPSELPAELRRRAGIGGQLARVRGVPGMRREYQVVIECRDRIYHRVIVFSPGLRCPACSWNGECLRSCEHGYIREYTPMHSPA